MEVDFPHAFRQISELRRLRVRCHVCRYGVTLERKELDRLTAVRVFGQVRRLAFCPACKEAGEDRLNMVLTCDWAAAPFEPRLVVVGKRPDPEIIPTHPGPFENLPRRALYKRKRLVA